MVVDEVAHGAAGEHHQADDAADHRVVGNFLPSMRARASASMRACSSSGGRLDLRATLRFLQAQLVLANDALLVLDLAANAIFFGAALGLFGLLGATDLVFASAALGLDAGALGLFLGATRSASMLRSSLSEKRTEFSRRSAISGAPNLIFARSSIGEEDLQAREPYKPSNTLIDHPLGAWSRSPGSGYYHHCLMGFVDLHSHVLPGLDDGVKSVAESVEVVAMLRRLGFETVCCTPHQKVGSWVPSATPSPRRVPKSSTRSRAGRVGVELRLGAENFWDELFVAALRRRRRSRRTRENGRSSSRSRR